MSAGRPDVATECHVEPSDDAQKACPFGESPRTRKPAGPVATSHALALAVAGNSMACHVSRSFVVHTIGTGEGFGLEATRPTATIRPPASATPATYADAVGSVGSVGSGATSVHESPSPDLNTRVLNVVDWLKTAFGSPSFVNTNARKPPSGSEKMGSL